MGNNIYNYILQNKCSILKWLHNTVPNNTTPKGNVKVIEQQTKGMLKLNCNKAQIQLST